MELKWMTKFVSRQYLDNTSRKDRSLDPYFINDIQINKSFTSKLGKNISIIFQLNNIFNNLYTPNGYTYSYQYGGQVVNNNYFYPMARRNWMLALNIAL
jgi:iron complex outermembrane receptor protein